MHHTFFDRYSNIGGIFQEISAISKLCISLVFTIVIATLPFNNFTLAIPFFIITLLFWAISKLPWLYLLKRWLIVLPFIVIASLGLINSDFANRFTTILLKALTAATILILLTSTTHFSELLNAMNELKIPTIFNSILAFFYRYLFILAGERERLDIARKSRTFTNSKKHIWKTLSWQLGSLFLRSIERSERVYQAMCARNFNIESRIKTNTAKPSHLLVTIIFISLIIFLRIAIWWRFE